MSDRMQALERALREMGDALDEFSIQLVKGRPQIFISERLMLAFAAAIAALALPDWLPIPAEVDTAKPPFDGESYEAGSTQHSTVAIVYWDENARDKNHPWAINDADTAYHRNWPTHYRPLPAPPKENPDG